MKSTQKRLRAIELSLTPQQVVVVWLRNVLQAGTCEDAVRRTPLPRGAVANAVYSTVRNSMKGQDDSLIERAVLQARQEADLLYNLVVVANVEVHDNRAQRQREYLFLLGYLDAEMHGSPTKERVENLRLAFLIFIKTVIILDAAIVQVAGERLSGQPVLFRDSAVKLAEQLQMATNLSTWFNELAVEVGVAEIDLEELRNSLPSETDRKISVWVNLARLEMLSTFGKTDEMHAATNQFSLLFGPKSDEAPKSLVH